ncbi:FCD domain-containing protein [Pseudodesulfovibrio sp. F-1]|uniref:FCD domain-containing protein n=2 Tax=Pseudodesulfovibrio alkaliphilus TaxID=2661613 RepID=A0A7K1KPC5_9BACT|nr:FCD domain-containing protein [Pseudodesulfovibrio alkaliphilus]
MDVKPVSRKGMYGEIVLQIKAMIDRGELRPGDRLPPERRLAGMFAVSRNTVREAIKALAEQELVESRQGAGTFVRSADEARFAATLAGVILRARPSLRDVFEARKLIEPEIAALAARHASPGIIARIEAALDEQERAVRRGETGADHDQLLHGLLAEASGNTVFCEVVKALHEDFIRSRVQALQSQERREASLAAHRTIVEAVRNGHVMQAEKAMRDHLEEIEAIVFARDHRSGA